MGRDRGALSLSAPSSVLALGVFHNSSTEPRLGEGVGTVARETMEDRQFVSLDTQLPRHYHPLNPGEDRWGRAGILPERQARIHALLQCMERWPSQDERGTRGGALEWPIMSIFPVMNEKFDPTFRTACRIFRQQPPQRGCREAGAGA